MRKAIVILCMCIFILNVKAIEENITLNDIPNINYELSNDKYTSSLELTIKINDIDTIDSYSFNNGEWKTVNETTFEFKETITSNGIYVISVKDKMNNSALKEIEINNIDSEGPKIVSIENSLKGNYNIVTINATDDLSGLDAYSYDSKVTWVTTNEYEVFKEGKYTFYVRDKAGNITEASTNIYFNDKTAPTIDSVIYGEIVDKKQKITIVASDIGGSEINAYLIKESSALEENDTWLETTSNQYITYLNPGTYYVFVKDSNKNISDFKLIDIKSTNNMIAIIFTIPVIIIFLGFFFIKKYKNNKV